MYLVSIKNGRVRIGVMGIAIILMFCSPAGADLITDPDLASGLGDVIDPPGGQVVDVSFGTTNTTLEARSDLRVLQTFTGFASGGTNVVNFTDDSLTDIQFAFSGAYNTTAAGVATVNELYQTSTNSAISLRNADPGSNTSTLTISFGTWNGSAFSANRTVKAAAFCLTQVYGTKSGQVTFRDAAGAAIAGASFSYTGAQNADGEGNHRDIYFGWDSNTEGSSPIGSITITFVDASDEWLSGFDDIAFAPSPVARGTLFVFE